MRLRVLSLLLPLAALAGCAGRETAFKMHVINAESPYEGVGVFDVNRDGRLDILCGKYWYEAPNWNRHFVREIEALHGYHQTFSDLPLDVDGDGWTDTICVSWFNKRISWIRNPGKPDATWEEIAVDEPGNIETAVLADVNADGRMDVLPNIFNGRAAWYECRPDRAAPHGAVWVRHPLPDELLGPGIGLGDINGDGRPDIVGCKGWAESPPDVRTNRNAVWTWHGEFDLRDPGIPILVHDVDGDGDADVIWGIGHNYGLYWLEQEKNAIGERVWAQHEIDKSWSQAHVTLLGDLDGDGRQDLVTGKRYHAHDTDPGAEDPRCLYWYTFDRAARRWQRHVIQEGGAAGTGTSSALVDIDRDGDLDLVAPGKSGLFLFENLRIQR